MTWALKSLAAAAAFVAAGSASAYSFTLEAGPSRFGSGYQIELDGLSGSGSLDFSPVLIGSLNAVKIGVTGVAPATAAVTYKTHSATKVVSIATASVAAPVQSLTLDEYTTGITLQKVNTVGGVTLTAAKANVATTGGFLEISKLSVDLSTKKVFATLNGGNGIGLLNNVELWDVATITGPTSFDNASLPFYPGESLTFTNTFSGLKINENAFNIFAVSLGLNTNGKLSLRTVTDFGTITSTMTLGVPEPTTYALMGIGLLAVNLAVRRRRAKQ